MKWLLTLLIVVSAPAQTLDDLRDIRTPEQLIRLADRLAEGPNAMAEWYIKSGESGGGTSTSDYAGSWADIASSVGTNDTVYVHGDSILRETIDLDDATVTFTVEPGTGRWTQTGRQLIAAGDWAAHTTVSGRTIWKEPIASAPVGFVYDYRFADVTDADGNTQSLPIGHLPESAAANLAAFITEITNADAPSWYFNSGNSTLYVYFPDNDNPTSSGKATEWLLNPGGTGFRVSANGVTVAGGRVDCWLSPTSGDTYWGFQLNGVTGCNVSDMLGSDCFYHTFGATGGACQDNVFEDIVCYTVARGTDSHLVQYSNSGALTGGVFDGVTVHMSDLRDYAGDPLNRYGSSAAIKGLAGHAGASGSIGTNGLIYANLTMIDYADCHSSGGTQAFTASGGNGSAPSDRDDMTTYQWLIRDSSLASAIGGQAQADGYVGMQRVFARFDGTTAGGISQANIVIASGGAIGMESCAVVGEMGAGTNNVIFRGGDDLTLSNCSVYCKGATDGFYFGAATDSLKATHCAFVRENTGYFAKGGSMNSPTMANNWYDANISDTQFAVPGAFNAQSEWEASIDTGGSYDVDYSGQFEDLDTLEPTPSSDIWTNRNAAANPDSPRGINGKAYAGNVGAWQAPATSPALNGRNRSRRCCREARSMRAN